MARRRRKKKDSTPKEVRPPVANRVVARIETWAEEAAQNYGLQLYDLSVSKQWVVRVFVDVSTTEPNEGGLPPAVDVADCAKVSRYLEGLLDADDDVWTKYTIEVSSPGIERKLTKPKHFELSIGKDVKVTVDPAVLGETQITGALERFEQQVAYVAAEERVFEIPFENISKAHVAFDFS